MNNIKTTKKSTFVCVWSDYRQTDRQSKWSLSSTYCSKRHLEVTIHVPTPPQYTFICRNCGHKAAFKYNNHTVSPMLTSFCRSNKTLNTTQFDFYCLNNMYFLKRSVSELRGFRNPKMSPSTFIHANLNPVIFTHTKAKHKTLFLYPGSKRNNKPADAG